MSHSVLLQYVLRQFTNFSFPIAMIFTMSQFKCKRKTAILAFIGISLAGSAINTLLFIIKGPELMKQLYAVILLIPSILFLLATTRDNPTQLFFNAFTAINALYFTAIMSHLILKGGLDDRIDLIWQDTLIRSVIYSLILFLFNRYLRAAYQYLAENMKKNSWRILAIIPFLFFFLVMFMGLYPHIRTDNLMSVVFLYIILCVVYYMIYQVFRSTYDKLNQEMELDFLQTQVRALQQQMNALQNSEEQIRVCRHDIRHCLANIASLLKGGNVPEALSVIDRFEALTHQSTPHQYCKNIIINAILSLYLQKALDEGILVKCTCDIPDNLPLDSIELATVFANAVENAVQACCRMPDTANREIIIKSWYQETQFILEVANTYIGPISFDEQHHPVTAVKGHGIGTQSILAFANKYQAILDYKSDDMFRLRLLLPFSDKTYFTPPLKSEGAPLKNRITIIKK